MGHDFNLFKGITIVISLIITGWVSTPAFVYATPDEINKSKSINLPKLKVLPYPDVKNFFKKDKKGYEGKIYDLVDDFLAQASLDYEIELMPWKRILRETKNHRNALIVSLVRNSKRENSYNWILPIIQVQMDLISRKNEAMKNLTKEQIFNENYTVVCDFGAVQCDMLLEFGFEEDNILKVNGMSHIQKANLVERGRVDFMIAELKGLKVELKKSGHAIDTLQSVLLFDLIESYLATGKNIDPGLLEKMQLTAISFQQKNYH